LEDATSPPENNKEKGKDHEESKVSVHSPAQDEEDMNHQINEDGAILDVSHELNSFKNKGEAKPDITMANFDELLNQKLMEQNTPEELDK
jgi:hypothetical protein